MRTLAKLDVGEGREAAILERDDGTTCWTADLSSSESSVEGTLIHVPAGTLVAGEVPPATETVQVSDATQTVVAGGRFLALILDERHDVWVTYVGTHNPPVPPEDELKRTPLDVEARCPNCEGLAWDRVEWRAPPDGPRARMRALVCRACGYYENPDLLGRRRRPEADDEPDYEMDPSPLPEEPTAADLLRLAPFPLYALATPRGRRPRLTQHSYRPGLTTSIVLEFGSTSVEVMLASEHPGYAPLRRARDKLMSELRSDLLDKLAARSRALDHDVFSLKLREAERPLQRAVDSAPPRTVSLPVEDDPVEFTLVEHGGAWAAGAEIDDHYLTITGRRVAPEKIALRRLTPEDELG